MKACLPLIKNPFPRQIKFRLLLSVHLWCIFALVMQAKEYRRIVSLVPSITQTVYCIGAKDQLVGCTSYCKIPASDRKQVVASAVKPNIEKIASIKPDLVFASNFTSSKDIEAIRKLGIRVEVLPSPDSFEAICRECIYIGDLLGCKSKAELIVSECRTKVETIEKRAIKNRKFNIFFQIGVSPLFTVVPGNFMCDYAHYLGCNNIASGLKSGQVGREFVVARNPDYIFIVTMGDIGKEERRNWYKFGNMKATQGKNIFIIDSNEACLPTPVSFVKTLETINQYIYK